MIIALIIILVLNCILIIVGPWGGSFFGTVWGALPVVAVTIIGLVARIKSPFVASGIVLLLVNILVAIGWLLKWDSGLVWVFGLLSGTSLFLMMPATLCIGFSIRYVWKLASRGKRQHS